MLGERPAGEPSTQGSAGQLLLLDSNRPEATRVNEKRRPDSNDGATLKRQKTCTPLSSAAAPAPHNSQVSSRLANAASPLDRALPVLDTVDRKQLAVMTNGQVYKLSDEEAAWCGQEVYFTPRQYGEVSGPGNDDAGSMAETTNVMTQRSRLYGQLPVRFHELGDGKTAGICFAIRVLGAQQYMDKPDTPGSVSELVEGYMKKQQGRGRTSDSLHKSRGIGEQPTGIVPKPLPSLRVAATLSEKEGHNHIEFYLLYQKHGENLVYGHLLPQTVDHVFWFECLLDSKSSSLADRRTAWVRSIEDRYSQLKTAKTSRPCESTDVVLTGNSAPVDTCTDESAYADMSAADTTAAHAATLGETGSVQPSTASSSTAPQYKRIHKFFVADGPENKAKFSDFAYNQLLVELQVCSGHVGRLQRVVSTGTVLILHDRPAGQTHLTSVLVPIPEPCSPSRQPCG